MAVTMLIGNTPVVPERLSEWSPFQLGDSIASVLANQYGEASYDTFRSALTQLALVLLLVSILTNSLARVLIWRVSASGRPTRSKPLPPELQVVANVFGMVRRTVAWLLPLLVLAFVANWLLAHMLGSPRYLPAPVYMAGAPLAVNLAVLIAGCVLFFALSRLVLLLTLRSYARVAQAMNYLMTGGEGWVTVAGTSVLGALVVLAVGVGRLDIDPGLRSQLLWLIAGLGVLTVQATFGVIGLFTFVTVVPLFLILYYLADMGISSLDWNFFTRLPAPPNEGGGMANALYGSALLVGLASLFAIPVGLLAAIYLAENRNSRIGSAIRFIGELLGGVPSIVIGIYVYTIVVVPMGHFSGWAGAFALGIMMIPIVMRASEESLKLVPESIRQASYALGASQWQTVLRVIVPAALPAIITGVFLAVARIAGETAPLLLTAGWNEWYPSSPNDFTPSVPYFIYRYAKSPYDDWIRQAWAAALVLLVLVMLLNFGVRFLTGKRVVLASRAD
jgi:phosphate transport system permease protein